MRLQYNGSRRTPEVFATDERPGAEESVYCKGCGEPLAGRPRRVPPRTIVTSMMCEPCSERYGHALVPPYGEPSFCYRCGGPDAIFVSRTNPPITYHVCPRCVPERAARYGLGDFEVPKPEPAPAAE